MTLRVPVAQARAAGLRKLASRKQLADALFKLKGPQRVSRLIWAKRAQGYLAKINSGELGALAEVVGDLQAAGEGSGSSFSQRNSFEVALDHLAAEYAAINQTLKLETIQYLNQVLLEGRTSDRAGHQPTTAVT